MTERKIRSGLNWERALNQNKKGRKWPGVKKAAVYMLKVYDYSAAFAEQEKRLGK